MRTRAVVPIVAALALLLTAPAHASVAGTGAEDPSPAFSLPEGAELGMPPALRDAATALYESAPAQLNGLIWDDERKVLEVHYFEGTDSLETPIAETVGAFPHELISDEFATADLVAEAERIVAEAQLNSEPVDSASPNPDGSGITIDYAGTSAEASTFVASVKNDVPVSYDLVEGQSQLTSGPGASRLDDGSPFFGGGRIIQYISSNGADGATVCTAGFPVQLYSSSGQPAPNTAPVMLTADHCSGNNWRAGTVKQDQSNLFFGDRSSGNSGGSDIGKLSLGSYSPYVFISKQLDRQRQWTAVSGAFAPVVGDYVCTSGASSGIQCGNEILSTNDVSGYPFYNQLVTIQQRDGLAAAGGGDSGGPIVVFDNRKVKVGGVMSDMINTPEHVKPCQGDPETTTRACGDKIRYANVYAFLNNNPGYQVLVAP